MQILLATLLPVILIFSMILFTINNIIFNMSTDFARDTAINYAQKLSVKIDEKFLKMSGFLNIAAENLSDIDFSSPQADSIAEEMLFALLESDPDIFSASVAFEPGILSEDTRFLKTFVKHDNKISEAEQTYAQLAAPESSSLWYTNPLFHGTTYFRSLDYYNYGTGIGSFYVGEASNPIKKDDKTIGVVLINLRYQDIMKFTEDTSAGNDSNVVLLSRAGKILYAPDKRFIGSHLADLYLPDKEKILTAMREGTDFTAESSSFFSGKDSFIHVFPISNDKEIFLYFDLPTEQLYQKAHASSQIIIATSILGLIILAASVFFAARNIVKPIKKITQSAGQIANGQLDVVFEEINGEKQSKNEIASLQTALKKMLKQLNQNHKLKLLAIEAKFEKEKTQAESNAKTQFLAKMSHEIRTPMNAIAGMSEILMSEELTERQQKYVRDIKISSDALLAIINDILDLSKLQTGNLQLLPVNYDFPAFIDNIASIAAFMAKEKNIEFVYTNKGKVPEVLFGDDIRLRQVLINILSNAIKFTQQGFIRFLTETTNDQLIFTITDTGIGIKQEDLPQLFESFQQLDEQKNRTIKGTGLGLAISKSIVQLMGGDIHVQSEYGQGSTFMVSVPLVAGKSEPSENASTAAKVLKAPAAKILVVDDNEINLHVASALLEFFAIDADTALSGAQAIAMVQSHDYDLVFMDHMMPEMDGVEATKQIRQLGEKYSKLPIIALTANAIVGAKEFLLTSGMDDFISKPISKNQLEEILAKWLPGDKKQCE